MLLGNEKQDYFLVQLNTVMDDWYNYYNASEVWRLTELRRSGSSFVVPVKVMSECYNIEYSAISAQRGPKDSSRGTVRGQRSTIHCCWLIVKGTGIIFSSCATLERPCPPQTIIIIITSLDEISGRDWIELQLFDPTLGTLWRLGITIIVVLEDDGV